MIIKNSFWNLRKLAILASASGILFASCGDGKGDVAESPEDIGDDTAKVVSNGVLNVGGELFSIPSPVQTAMLIQKVGAQYDKAILNPTSNANQYTTDFYKALNLGIYGADLGYVTMYNKSGDALGYLATVKKMADDLGVSGAFDAQTMERINKNIGIKDSMLVLVGVAYRESDAYLKELKRFDVSGLILTGGWIESLNFAVATLKGKDMEEVKKRLAEQKQALGSIVKLINRFNTQPEYASLLEKLNELQKIYDTIEYKYVFVEPVTDPKTKTTTLNSHTDIKISKEQVDAISQKVTELRNQIIAPAKA